MNGNVEHRRFVGTVVDRIDAVRREHPDAPLVAEMNGVAAKAIAERGYTLRMDPHASAFGVVVWTEMNLRVRLIDPPGKEPIFTLGTPRKPAPSRTPVVRRLLAFWAGA
jgi:hypothetical protein